MNELQQAREAVIWASLYLASGRWYRENVQGLPGPYDDAQAELEWDQLDEALERWREARS
jgi:hypothetical protein